MQSSLLTTTVASVGTVLWLLVSACLVQMLRVAARQQGTLSWLLQNRHSLQELWQGFRRTAVRAVDELFERRAGDFFSPPGRHQLLRRLVRGPLIGTWLAVLLFAAVPSVAQFAVNGTTGLTGTGGPSFSGNVPWFLVAVILLADLASAARPHRSAQLMTEQLTRWLVIVSSVTGLIVVSGSLEFTRIVDSQTRTGLWWGVVLPVNAVAFWLGWFSRSADAASHVQRTDKSTGVMREGPLSSAIGQIAGAVLFVILFGGGWGDWPLPPSWINAVILTLWFHIKVWMILLLEISVWQRFAETSRTARLAGTLPVLVAAAAASLCIAVVIRCFWGAHDAVAQAAGGWLLLLLIGSLLASMMRRQPNRCPTGLPRSAEIGPGAA